MEYTVQSQSLTQIANAIREKTRDPALLEFPDEFVVAIRSIQPHQTDVIGGTVVWNQYCEEYPTTTTQGITLTNDGNGKLTASGTSLAGDNHFFIYFTLNRPIYQNHKYFVSIGDLSADNSAAVIFRNRTTSANYVNASIASPSHSKYAICNAADDGIMYYYLNFPNANTTITGTICPMVIDLTTLLGSTIADKIYILEQSTPGAGVAIIKQLLTKDYYPYSLPILSSIMYANDWENFGDSYILNGFLRLSNNSLYRWGDILSNGNVTPKTARIAMTDLIWTSGTMAAYEATLPNWVGSNAVEPILETVISDAYPTALYDVWSGPIPTDLSAAPDKYLYQIYESQSPDTKYYKICIKDTSIATVSDLMTALAGKEIVYATSSESYSVAGKRFRGRADIDLPDPSSIVTSGKLLTYIDGSEAAIYTLSSTSTQVLYTWQDENNYAAAALDSGLQWEDDNNGRIVWWADDAPDMTQEDYEWFISLYEEII